MYRDVRWLSSHSGQFISVSPEQIAFFADNGADRPELLDSLPLNQRVEQDRLASFDLSSLSDDALALGYSSGKVLVSKLITNAASRNIDSNVELVCDILKPAILLDFSPISQSLLSVCYEGSRSQDYTVCVFDICRPKLCQFCVHSAGRISDTTWFIEDANLLGMGCSRSIKFYDIRESARPAYTVPVASHVRSLSADNIRNMCIACIIEDYACIYDRRRMSSPLYRIQLSYFKKSDAGSVKVQWNPHYPQSISCFRRNSRVVTELISPYDEQAQSHQYSTELYSVPLRDTFDLVQGSFQAIRYSDDNSAVKSAHPYHEINHKFLGVQRITGFSWHPNEQDRLLVVASDGNRNTFDIRIATIKKFVTGEASPRGGFAYAVENRLFVHDISPSKILSSTDISFIMHQRAMNNYGTSATSTFEG